MSSAVLRLGMTVPLLALAGCSARQARVEAEPSAPPVVRPAAATVQPVPVIVPMPATAPVVATTLTRPEAITPLAIVEGEVTYYASYFDGRKTASGIVFSNEVY